MAVGAEKFAALPLPVKIKIIKLNGKTSVFSENLQSLLKGSFKRACQLTFK